MKTDFIRKVLRINLGLAFIEGLFVFWQYIQTPSESAAAIFLGFSPLRLAILASVLFLLGLIGYGLISSWRARSVEGQVWKTIEHLVGRIELFWFFVLLFGSLYAYVFSSEHDLGRLAVYRTSLLPILIWLMLITGLGLISFIWLRSYGLAISQKYRDVLLPALLAFGILGCIILVIAVTRIGLNPDAVYWQEAGTPILLPQVLIAWLAGLLLFYILNRLERFSSKKTELLLSLLLWILASTIWLAEPLTPAYNALEPKAPNYQVYPFGDALLYDVTAHGFLIGKPIQSDFWVKPLYTLFLSGLHLFSKENFGVLVFLQVIILASVPVFVYLLASELSNHPAGLVAGILVILRERNGIALSNVIEVSHSKLLMSDVFSMGLMALLLWLVIKWIKRPTVHQLLPFMIGGFVALLTLTRGHPVVLLPVIGCIFLLMGPRSPLRWGSLILLLLGFTIPMLPWFWRNYRDMGKFAFQNPISAYSAQIAGLYSMTPGLVMAPTVLNETNAAAYERLQSQVIEFVMQHPDEVFRFVSAHYSHNTIYSYIFLPHSFELDTLRTYVKSEGFWHNWAGTLNTQGEILLVLNMAILALGIGSTWKNAGWFACIPLLIGMGYNLSVSVGRLSGWRFILPADWITLVYYAIGLMQFSSFINYALFGRDESAGMLDEESSSVRSTKFAALVIGSGAVFLSISLLLTYGHTLFTPSDTPPTRDQLTQVVQRNSEFTHLSSDTIGRFLDQENAVMLSGQALYPAFFKADSGVLNYYWLAFDVKPYNRIVFHLMGPQSVGVILPATSEPDSFRGGADVIVLGCRNENNYIDAVSVLITSTEAPIAYSRDPMPPLICPFPEPD